MADYFTAFANQKVPLLETNDYRSKVYDFQAPCLYDGIRAIEYDASKAYKAGSLKLPQDKLFIVLEAEDGGEPEIFFVTKTKSELDWRVRTFIRLSKPTPRWVAWPIYVELSPTSVVAKLDSNSSPKKKALIHQWIDSPQPGAETLDDELRWMAQAIPSLIYILAQPRTHTITSIAIPKSINQLRRFRKKPALPQAISVIRMDVTWLRAYVPKGGTHASPTPHDRKGYRCLRRSTGRTVIVPPTTVLGGSGNQQRRVVVKDGTM